MAHPHPTTEQCAVITHSRMENDHITMCSKKLAYKSTRKQLYKKKHMKNKTKGLYKNGCFCSNKTIFCVCVCVLHICYLIYSWQSLIKKVLIIPNFTYKETEVQR